MQKALNVAVFITFCAICPYIYPALAQAPATTAAAPASTTRVLGSLVRVDGMKLTLKDQQGAETAVTLTDATRLLGIAPGQTSMASATPIKLSDIQPGDRLLVRVQPAGADGSMVATTVVAMKQADIAQQHEQSQTAWQHGVGGLVKSVDAASRSIVIDSRAAGGSMTVQLGPSAVVKRYAAESVQYEQAQPSSIEKIMPGDQLRARGTAGAQHAFTADEVVAGSFKNLSGRLTAVDAQAGTVSFADLSSKQNVSIKVTNDTQLRKLDDATAEKLAASMKPASGPGGEKAGGEKPGGPSEKTAGNAGPAAHGVSEEGTTRRGGGGPGTGAPGEAPAADLQQALAHAAPIHLSDLRKNDLVMVVASAGADNQLGAVTMVTGVEPLLRASPNGSAAMLSSWSLGGGAPSQ